MTIWQHARTFAGLPVRDYDPEKKSRARTPCVYRISAWEYGQRLSEFPDLLDRFLAEHGGKDLTALVIGPWRYEDMVAGLGGRGSAEVVEALVASRKRMPNLRALFFGDITREECEISWINHEDLSPLLAAFSKLEEFRIRGVGDLTFGKLKHGKLRSFAIESGGLPEALLREVVTAELPKLEHLELWLGTERYGGISDPAPLGPLLSGKHFRKLRYLGLRNSAIADEVARAVVDSSLLERLKLLDLSLGNLSEVGAEALLRSPVVRKLEKLDLHHHFISPAFVEELHKLPIEVDASDAQKPVFYTHGETTEVWRFNAVSE